MRASASQHGHMSEILVDAGAIQRGLRRIAGEIAEHGTSDLCLIGIRRGGEPAAKQIAQFLHDMDSTEIPVGSIDITLYRDDAATALPNPKIGPSHIPCAIEGKRVVLVDDVLYTGRTIRAAVDAILDYGRPRRIELAVIVDRGGRELPIQANYVVKTVDVPASVRVEVTEVDGNWVASKVKVKSSV